MTAIMALMLSLQLGRFLFNMLTYLNLWRLSWGHRWELIGWDFLDLLLIVLLAMEVEAGLTAAATVTLGIIVFQFSRRHNVRSNIIRRGIRARRG